MVCQSILSILWFPFLLPGPSAIHTATQELQEGMKTVGSGCTGEPKHFSPQAHPKKKRSVRPSPPCDPTSPAFPSSYLHSLVKAKVRFCCLCRAVPQAPKAEVLEGASPFPSGTASPRTSSSLSFCAIELIAFSCK